jgi:putative flavoprotein involved in K+ transport
MGYYNKPVHEHPQKERVRAKANHYVTGRDGGRDIDLRKFATEGMQLYGRLLEMKQGRLSFGDDLKHNLDRADEVANSIKATIDKYINSMHITAPAEEPYQPLWQPEQPAKELEIANSGITSIVWCVGFTADYSWIEVPIFDGKGYPSHQRGVSTVPGIYFLGLPWQYTWGSGRFSGVAQDARYLAGYIEQRHTTPQPGTTRGLNELALGS